MYQQVQGYQQLIWYQSCNPTSWNNPSKGIQLRAPIHRPTDSFIQLFDAVWLRATPICVHSTRFDTWVARNKHLTTEESRQATAVFKMSFNSCSRGRLGWFPWVLWNKQLSCFAMFFKGILYSYISLSMNMNTIFESLYVLKGFSKLMIFRQVSDIS